MGKNQDVKAAQLLKIREEKERQGKEWKEKRPPNKKWLLQKDRADNLMRLIIGLVDDQLRPVLVFCFSQAECNRLAPLLKNSIPKESSQRQLLRSDRIGKEMLHISLEARHCQEVTWFLDFLQAGVGIHHGGLVPVVRELTEKLFKQCLLNVLFCTETFGMGLNMPARAVVFHFRGEQPLTKFDGREQRVLTPTEYLQMSGRAGRRQLDSHGTAVLALDDPFQRQDLKSMLAKQSPVVRSGYEMQASSALRLSKHGRTFLDWFGTQTLLQFESKHEAPVHEDHIDRLVSVMQDPRLALLECNTGKPTALGWACGVVECGDVLLIGRLISQGCFDSTDAEYLLAYFIVFVLERCHPRDGNEKPLSDTFLALATTCECEAKVVDQVISEKGLSRRMDDSVSLPEKLRAHRILVDAFHESWLSGSSLDDFVARSNKSAQNISAGMLVRAVRRVEEFARQVAEALQRLGKIEQSDAIKRAIKEHLHRGLPFADSLYFPDELRGCSDQVLDLYNEEGNTDCWRSDHKHGDMIHLNPCEIGFSQDSISGKFGDGTYLRQRLAWMNGGRENPEDIACGMKVIFYRGQVYTLDNRRLALLRLYTWGVAQNSRTGDDCRNFRLQFMVAADSGARKEFDQKFTSCCCGARTVIRQTGEVIGISPSDSLVSLAQEDESLYEADTVDDAGSFWDQYDKLSISVLASPGDADSESCEDDLGPIHASPESISLQSDADLPCGDPVGGDLALRIKSSALSDELDFAAPKVAKARGSKDMFEKGISYCMEVADKCRRVKTKKSKHQIKHSVGVLELFDRLLGELPPSTAERADEFRTMLEALRS